ncbi:HAD-IIA family hydrolase [Halospeciosus flavus]|uniref:HAD-IIA family hydrolase n=2 Tax=Halospeciosus flavus TaxID=3032283 RepID=A0ABD5Z1Y3_9EURY|nr:HAD hydrolase-like protein [Halospeciosus flavus]
MFVLGQPELVDEVRDAGLDVVDDGVADVVVAAYDDRITFDRLTRALRAFGPGTVFVATNRDRSTPEPDGLVPGAGATVGAVEGMTGHDPLVVGKPETRLGEIAAETLGISLDGCLMVGDNVHTDILMAERAGIDSAFVRTGVSSEADVESTGIRPTHVLDSLADLPSLF